jgi:Tfp pilus assembly protein PilZ
VDHAKLAQLVSEFVPLNRRRIAGELPLTLVEQQRWGELRDMLAYGLGQKAPIGGAVPRPLRVSTQLKVRYGQAGEEGVVHNLSERGVFIRCARPLEPGTSLRLEIDPGDGDASLELDAAVVWVREIANMDGPVGFGVAFQDLGAVESVAVCERIERALREATGS